MTTGILLAAGFSARFGSPKALAPLNDSTVIAILQQEMLKSRLDEIVIVTGAHAEGIKPLLLKHKKIKVVHNKDYNLGQTSSFQAGLGQTDPKSGAVLLLPVDYPLLTAPTLDLLIEGFFRQKARILVPTFNGRKGHPPVFSALLQDEFLRLDPGEGINTVIHRHDKDTVLLPVQDPSVLKTFNTKEEWEAIKPQET
jgi:molybdenum cofactor cytidylyltransferase